MFAGMENTTATTTRRQNTWTVTVVARLGQSCTVTTAGTKVEAVAAAKAAAKLSERWGSERWTTWTAVRGA